MITTLAELKTEFTNRARGAGLEVSCAMDGAFHAEIAVIAEAPGDREVETGRPLVGGSGSKLWEVLRKFGFNRQQLYVTNVSKRQVSFGDDKRNPINKHELEVWRTLLQWELSQLPNLKYILVLGNMSLTAITGHTGITDWRGSVLLDTVVGENDSDGRRKHVTAICTYNPAMILREPKLELTFTFDLKKLKMVVDNKWVVHEDTIHINPTFSQAREYMRHVRSLSDWIAYDIETMSNETACIGIAGSPNEAMCINFRGLSEPQFTLEEECILRRDFQALAKAEHERFVAQNNMFDSSWLLFKDRIRIPPIAIDTMLGHHCLYPQLPHNLGYLTTQYTTHPFYKNEKDDWREGGDIDGFWRYNGKDCCRTHGIATSIHSELKQQSLDKFFYEHVMHAQPFLLQMVVGGVKVDMEVKNNLRETIGQHVQELLQEFYEAVQAYTGDSTYEPNPKSPKQLSELLFTKLRLVGRGTSTNAENRERMYSHPATTEPKRAILRSLNDFAKEQKFYSTYATTAVDDDGRLRCTYNQTGVQSAPGRLSSSGMLWKNSEGEETGMNLQNQPERAYEMYIADEGYGLGYFDMAQAEARLVACFAVIETWIEQFERARLEGGFDAHRALASDMFKIAYDEVPTFDRYDISKGYIPPEGKSDRDPTLRYIAKRCRHGLNYRMGPDRLSSTTGLSLADATNAYRVYHRITPELQQWWGKLEEEVRRTKTLFNAYGRRFIVLERITPEALESIVAFKPQSTLGDHVVRTIYRAQEDDRWPINARMWLNIHDALICLAPDDKVKTCMAIMKKYAEEPINIIGVDGKMRQLIIPAETKIAMPDDKGVKRWSTMKAIEVEAAK
jgi:DNA polymerase